MKFHNNINQRRISALSLLEKQLAAKTKTLSKKNATLHGVTELPLSDSDIKRMKTEAATLRTRIISSA